MKLLEADPNLELYHGNFRRPTKTLRQIYKLSTDEKLKTVLRQIFTDRRVEPEEILSPIIEPTQEAIEAYKEKQERKLESAERRSENAIREAEQLREHNRKIADCMNGTPILIGHHSEGRHRRELERMDNRDRKAYELIQKAKHYDNKAENILNPHQISSDDPEAIKKLVVEIEKLEVERNYYKNEYVVKPEAKVFEEGSEHVRKIYLESVSRRIRDKKKRIEDLRRLAQIPEVDKTINGVRIYSEKSENRLRMEFNGKPSPEIISELKRSGFHWSPFNMVWQRMISNQAIYHAERIAEKVTK